MNPAIAEATSAFKRDLPKLVRESPDKWIAYEGAQVLGMFEDQADVYRLLKRQGIDEQRVLVRWIEPGADSDVIECRMLDID